MARCSAGSGVRTTTKTPVVLLLTESLMYMSYWHNALRTGLEVALRTMKADLVRWVFVAIMGQTAMLLGVLYFFMRYAR